MQSYLILAFANGIGLFGLFYLHTALQSVREHTAAIALVLVAFIAMESAGFPAWEDARAFLTVVTGVFLLLVVLYGIIAFTKLVSGNLTYALRNPIMPGDD